MACEDTEMKDSSNTILKDNEAYILDYPSRCILRNKAQKKDSEPTEEKQTDEEKTRGVIINDGTLDGSIQQLLLTILYPPGSSTRPSLTIIPCLTLTSGAIDQSMQNGLTNPQSADQYVDALAQFSNQFNLKFSLTKGLNNGADKESLDATWGQIVDGAQSEPMSQEDLKKYVRLQSQLWSPPHTNPITGITTPRQKTPLYACEQQAKLGYCNALSRYHQIRQETLAKKGGAATWSEVGPIEQQKVEMAKNEWISSGKDQVELIISEMDNLLKGYPGELITAARNAFLSSTNESKNFGQFHQCIPSPADIFDPLSTRWSKIRTSKGQNYSKVYETAVKAGFDASVQWNIWNVSMGTPEPVMTYQDSETINTTISLEYARVYLTRPWFMINWMQSNNWTYLDTKPGSISKGTVANNIDKDLLIGAYPTELILARNVKVTAKFSNKVLDALKSASLGLTSVSWGPFKIGGLGFSSSTFEETASSQEINGTITMSGSFVIGYVLNTLPYSAPEQGKVSTTISTK